MKIIIVGGGQVGGTLAEYLVQEKNEIVVIDTDRSRLNDLSSHLDLGTVLGSGSYPAVLEEAGCADADAIIAVSNSDETNMLACQVAYTLFQTPLKIARIRSQQFHEYLELFDDQAIPIDFVITPELVVTDFIMSLIKYPGAAEVAKFAGNKLKLVVIRVTKDSFLYNKTIDNIYNFFPNLSFTIVSLSQESKADITFSGNTIIDEHIEVCFLAATIDVELLLRELQPEVRAMKNIMIVGGGNIGYSLATRTDENYNVKIIEHNKERCLLLAEKINNGLVLRGDAADRELLLNENIDSVDLFCSLTNNDGVNIMSALLARRLGAKKVISLITRDVYAEIVEGSQIDVAISPQEVTLSAVLKYIRRGDVEQVHSMNEGHSEVLELIVHGDARTSRVIGIKAQNMKLPQGAKLLAISRGDKVFFDTDSLIIEPLDHIIIFIADKKQVIDIEQLFKVDVTYI